MAKSRVKRASKKKPLNIPSFLPGMRGSAKWHVRDVREDETPHTLNHMGGVAEMAIPNGGTVEDEFIKLHELLHAAHSPVEEPRDIVGPDKQIVRKENLLIAEEMRINLVGRTYVGYENLPDLEEMMLEQAVYKAQKYTLNPEYAELRAYVEWCLVSWTLQLGKLTLNSKLNKKLGESYRDYDITYQALGLFGTVDDLIYSITEHLWNDVLADLFETGDVPHWDRVIQLGIHLQEFFDQLQAAMSPDSGDGSDEEDDPDLEDMKARHGMVKPKKPPSPHQIRQNLREDLIKRATGKPEPQDSDHTPVWGKMKTRIARMPLTLPKKLVSKMKYKGTDEGAVPRYIHRLPVDGKIFGRKKKTPGGSVLIDDSGSMGFETEDLSEIIHAAPAVNIAAYSGYNSSTGELVILAKGGKYADPTDDFSARPKGSNNLIDLPALEWLATMPKPRIWVSDTRVTLVRGSTHKAAKQVLRLCKQKDINIVHTPEEAAEVFQGKREIYR